MVVGVETSRGAPAGGAHPHLLFSGLAEAGAFVRRGSANQNATNTAMKSPAGGTARPDLLVYGAPCTLLLPRRCRDTCAPDA